MSTLDKETKEVFSEQNKLKSLIGNEGWPVARKRLTDRILELQNTAEYAEQLDTIDPVKLTIAMKADKRAAEVLFDWLANIEGTASEVEDHQPKKQKSHIVIED